MTLIEHPFEIVAEGQMKKNTKAKEMRPVVMSMLKNNVRVDGMLFSLVLFSQRVINKLKSMI